MAAMKMGRIAHEDQHDRNVDLAQLEGLRWGRTIKNQAEGDQAWLFQRLRHNKSYQHPKEAGDPVKGHFPTKIVPHHHQNHILTSPHGLAASAVLTSPPNGLLSPGRL